MATRRPTTVCLVSSISGNTKVAWRDAFDLCITAAEMTPADYTSEAVDGAACMLAFIPGGDSEVLHEAAFAMGRALPVLYIVPVDEDLQRLDPKPVHVVEIELHGPDPLSGSREAITAKLAAIAENSRVFPASAPRVQSGAAGRSDATATAGSVSATTVDQGEALLQAFLADGLSERLMQRLLLQAGCPESWVEFRLQQQFGGW